MGMKQIRDWEALALELSIRRRDFLSPLLSDPDKLSALGWYTTGERYTNGRRIIPLNRLDGADPLEDDMPSGIIYYGDSGAILSARWTESGKYHREGGPAVIDWVPVCGISLLDRLEFYIDGKRFSRGHPSTLKISRIERTIKCQYHHIEGSRISFWEFYDQSSAEDKKLLLRYWFPRDKL